jgi:hypothetical protein
MSSVTCVSFFSCTVCLDFLHICVWLTGGPRPVVARPAKLFVNLLLVSANFFIFFIPNDFLKTNRVSCLLFYVKELHILLALELYAMFKFSS